MSMFVSTGDAMDENSSMSVCVAGLTVDDPNLILMETTR